MLKRLLAMVLLGYSALCLALYTQQDALLFHPQPRGLGTQALLRLPVAQGHLHISHRARAEAQASGNQQALLYFGGNAEDVSYNVAEFAAQFPQHDLYLPHYRGYGGSTGKPSEASLYADALALYAFLHERHGAQLQLTVVGRSLGSGVAVYLASQRSVKRLVLITPYDSIANVAAGHYPFMPIQWLIKHRFDAAMFAPAIKTPTLILQAEQDFVIPPHHSTTLALAFPNKPDYRVLAGTDHASISSHPDYFRDWLH
jgi:uncharacterized protein